MTIQTPAAPCSSSQDGAAPRQPVGASRGVDAFLSEWIAPQPSRLYVNPPRPDYGPQYRGIGECPF